MEQSSLTQSKLDKYKEDNDIRWSEDVFELDYPPDHQCMRLNDMISNLEFAEKYSKEAREAVLNRRYTEADDLLSEVEYYMVQANEIEELRTVIEELREWGRSWKLLAKQLIENSELSIEELVDLCS